MSVILIDNGSGSIRSGLSGDEKPKSIIPAFVARSSPTSTDIFVGPAAQEKAGTLQLVYPIDRGNITNFDIAQKLWSYVFQNELKVDPASLPILLSEAPLPLKAGKEKTAEIFFNVYNSPGISLNYQSNLSLYASGKTTGLVFNSGYSSTYAVPIYEGFSIPHAIIKSKLAGRDIDKKVAEETKKSVVESQKLKEQSCSISPNGEFTDYTTGAPEILYQPYLGGLDEAPGIDQVIFDSISKTDINVRKSLYDSIFLTGGTTLLGGFQARLEGAVRTLAPKSATVKVVADADRLNAVFVGASIFSGSSGFKDSVVTKLDYQEVGPSIIHRRVQ